MSNKQTFESYLQEIHMEDYHGTDDDSPDAFSAWLVDMQVDDLIKYAELWGLAAYREGILAGMDRAIELIKKPL